MKIIIGRDKQDLGRRAAAAGAARIRTALRRRGRAHIILATGASQFEMLGALLEEPGIAWHRVTVFHLDEYIGLPINHPASFRLYLWQRFLSRLPVPVAAFHAVNGETAPAAECRRLATILRRHPIDVAFIGIGENGHLAFNDPPADFRTAQPYLVVNLDRACRRQQLGEGWFRSLTDVPRRAISMSVRQILKSGALIVSVPDRRKAEAVRNSLGGPVTPLVPGSILRKHPRAAIYLDPDSAALLARL